MSGGAAAYCIGTTRKHRWVQHSELLSWECEHCGATAESGQPPSTLALLRAKRPWFLLWRRAPSVREPVYCGRTADVAAAVAHALAMNSNEVQVITNTAQRRLSSSEAAALAAELAAADAEAAAIASSDAAQS